MILKSKKRNYTVKLTDSYQEMKEIYECIERTRYKKKIITK